MRIFRIRPLPVNTKTKNTDMTLLAQNKSPTLFKEMEQNPERVQKTVRGWLKAVLEPMNLRSAETDEGRGRVNLAWCYGINPSIVAYMPKHEIIMYPISKIIILYNGKILRQRHYLQHDREVSSIAIGKDDLVCSGEMDKKPKIHIWRATTLQNLEVISSGHNDLITQLCFSYDDAHIISCSHFTISIYEWKTKSVLISFRHSNVIVYLSLLPRMEIETTCSFIVCNLTEFTQYTLSDTEMSVNTLNLVDSGCISHINCCLGAIFTPEDNPETYLILTGHKDGTVLIWAYNEY